MFSLEWIKVVPIWNYFTRNSHDRFLIIDNTVYHIGASLKDLGKKWFAFCKMSISAAEVVGRIR